MSFSPQKGFITDRNTPQHIPLQTIQQVKKPDVDVLGWRVPNI
jgi:hypothetical protein